MSWRSWAFFGVIGLLSPGAALAGDCDCTCPVLPALPVNCAATFPVSTGSCTCQTGCTSGGCPSGFTEVGSEICFFTVNETCQKSCTGLRCSACRPGTFGANCQACPNCNGGTCNEGMNGNGQCSNCPAGRAGPFCQFSRATTCSGHGSPSFAGACTCDVGYAGAACNTCAPNFFGFPDCRFCDGNTCNTAQTGGTCAAAGGCTCPPGFAGARCEACAPGFFGWPTCRACDAATTCNGRGACDANGFCLCADGFTGPGCTECQPGRIGPDCAPCPTAAPEGVGVPQVCAGRGVCVLDDAGAPACQCEPGFDGPACTCGDGFLDRGEACDDANLAPGDCCGARCELEAAGAPCGDDGNGCTDDACDGAGFCEHPANAAPCDDGRFCNGADRCLGGACGEHAGDPCAGGAECNDRCDEGGDTCRRPGTACTDDGNPCTADACDAGGACQHGAIAGACDDGDPCTVDDACADGQCRGRVEPTACLDRFKCYSAAETEEQFVPISVTLADAFERKIVEVLKPGLVCAPTDVDGEVRREARVFLVCYAIRNLKTRPRQAIFPGAPAQQFEDEFGATTLDVQKVKSLCVPAVRVE